MAIFWLFMGIMASFNAGYFETANHDQQLNKVCPQTTQETQKTVIPASEARRESFLKAIGRIPAKPE
jgi:hypothetical protein